MTARSKVLDFGLATVTHFQRTLDKRGELKITRRIPRPLGYHRRSVITASGSILGTGGLYVPGTGKGRRSGDEDHHIWAFGCVLLTKCSPAGCPSRGALQADTLALIDRGKPNFGLLPSASTATNAKALLRPCLDEEPRRRWPDCRKPAHRYAKMRVPLRPILRRREGSHVRGIGGR